MGSEPMSGHDATCQCMSCVADRAKVRLVVNGVEIDLAKHGFTRESLAAGLDGLAKYVGRKYGTLLADLAKAIRG
jgi:hypothetical protein